MIQGNGGKHGNQLSKMVSRTSSFLTYIAWFRARLYKLDILRGFYSQKWKETHWWIYAEEPNYNRVNHHLDNNHSHHQS